MGAIASGGVRILNPEVAGEVPSDVIEQVARSEQTELERREKLYRGDRPPLDVRGRTVVLVDDGLATGSTMRAAVRALRKQSPERIVVAVPIGAPETCELLADEADDVVCAATPRAFRAVGLWYDDFDQTTDEEVRELLGAQRASPAAEMLESEVEVDSADGEPLRGTLTVPPGAQGVVLFAHGSGSSRFSARNRHVAQVLQRTRFATLLMDLLTEREEEAERYTRHLRFDIDLLAERLVSATLWLAREQRTRQLPIGHFGASTGAAAALVAAAREPEAVAAVVSRGGRPDLAGAALPLVRAPTLLIVGGADTEVLELNREALALLRSEKRLEIVPGATHLFEEPGALDRVAVLAARWFAEHLRPVPGWIAEAQA